MSKQEELQLEKIRHSLSHLMSMVIMKMHPKTGLGFGPAIEDGFYQDYGLLKPISSDLLPKLEKEIKKLIKKDIKFEQHDMSFEQALKLYKKDPYKTEMIKDLKKAGEKKVSFYKSDWFENLCKGPHVKSTKEINPGAFKLTRVAGAYWKGDEKNEMLQRIYGVAFKTKKELDAYLKQQKEAEKRDHRKIGKQLDLFISSDLVGKGLPLLTPKGAIIRQELEKFIIEQENKRGYLRTYTPDLARVELYKKSGHWAHYKDDMYPAMDIDGEDYVLRPMTCPHQFMIYKSRPRSYRELPLRYAEIAKQYRKEQSGELSGLMRVMVFSLADAHIICRPNQIEQEFKDAIELITDSMKTLGIKDYWYRLSKWDPKDKKKYVNKPKEWEETQAQMKRIINKLKLKYEEAKGEAAFYGPKLDIQMKNVNGKEDTAFTVQIDFDLPEKFNLTYTDEKGVKQKPMVIHRSSIGCIERTMAFLIELYAGAFPAWLAPVQAQIIPISQKFNEYGEKIKKQLQEQGLRAELDDNDETLGKKIRNNELQKIPYLLIVGEKEEKADSVAVRDRTKGDIGIMKTSKFVERIQEEIEKKT